jgi:hypothetical protein
MANHELLAILNPGGPGRIRILASMASRPGWDIEALVLATDGGPAVSELKIRPHPGPEGTNWQTPGWETPTGGITTRLVREINVGELLDLARDCARSQEAAVLTAADDPAPDLDLSAGFRDELATALRERANQIGTLSTKSKPGRRPRIDHYLTWAERYAEKVAAGVRNPNATLAKESKEEPDFVRDTISRARLHGLLSRGPGRGRAGGTLTPKALALIAERQQTEEVDENG